MSGKFEKGRWIVTPSTPEGDHIVVDVKVNVERADLDDLISDLSNASELFRLKRMELNVTHASFSKRLKYLITGTM